MTSISSRCRPTNCPWTRAAEPNEVDEAAEDSEPVFREPKHAELPAAPFVLPGVPRPRKKRSVVRMLVGTALGGVVG